MRRAIGLQGVALVLLGVAVIVLALSVPAASTAPSPPTPRVARLERQVASLQRQLSQTQTLAIGTAQQLQASHDAFDRVSQQVDNLTERVAWLEARVGK